MSQGNRRTDHRTESPALLDDADAGPQIFFAVLVIFSEAARSLLYGSGSCVGKVDVC